MRTALLLSLLLAACTDAPDDVSTAGPYDDPATVDTVAVETMGGAEGDISEADAIAEVGMPDDDAADVAAPDADLAAADLAGDWVYCSGNAALDEAATFQGDDVRTYLHDRPSMFATYEVRDGVVSFDDGRTYRVSRDGDRLVLADNAGVSVYAPSPEGC